MRIQHPRLRDEMLNVLGTQYLVDATGEVLALSDADATFLAGMPGYKVIAEPVATVRRLDGQPLERGPDGLSHGEPMQGLTPDMAAALPRLDPDAPEGPAEYGEAPAKKGRRKA